MKKLRTLMFLVFVLFACNAAALDVPLMVHEQDGVDRIANPVNSGVPLPRGAVKDVAQLRLVDSAGRPVLASIEPRCRWLGDQSLKWVIVHFSCSNGTRKLLARRL